MKFIIISGGVLSGLGKGIITASLGYLLKTHGFKVTAFKCDMYLNIDAGTMNPLEHGEVFVTHDGLETDQDLGHYERFMHETLSSVNYTTNGQVYKTILDKERALEYKGECVQPYHHIPPEIIRRWKLAGKKHNADIVLIEMGGTVGEYEGLLFFEAARRMKLASYDDVCFVHIGYLPAPGNIGELKSKPLQQSIYFLNTMGIQPNFIIGRAEKEIDAKRKQKIALASGKPVDRIFSAPDLDSVYKVPLKLEEQKFTSKIMKYLNLPKKPKRNGHWSKIVKKLEAAKKEVSIAMVGKYQKTGDYVLEDAYVSVVEALKHAGWQFGVKPKLVWINSEELEAKNDKEVEEYFEGIEGIIVPQGWGSRGTEGKIKAAKFAREKKVPYLGLCFGMQMASIEFGRNVVGLDGANTTEANPETPHAVIHIMPNQAQYLAKKQYGGTIRLGGWPCVIKQGTKLKEAYIKYGKNMNAPWYQINKATNGNFKPKSASLIFERHRHRYEFNNTYKQSYEEKGFVFSGTSPDGTLVEAIEIKDHPFFVGTQFHPEYISRPITPHPIFLSYIESLASKK